MNDFLISRVQSDPWAGRSRRVGVGLAASLTLASLLVGGAAVQAQDASPAADAPVASGIDGAWTIDTEIGDFSDYSSSWVGFRVAEELQGLGNVEAVGRTPAVSGSLEAAGTSIDAATIEVDLTTITSDQPRRDPAIQRALDTVTFPTATIASRGPADLGALPVEGEPFTATLPATLTIRGISQDVDVPLTGQMVGDVVVVVGTLPIDFTAFDVTMPTAPVVLSVEDTGSLEWQLFLRRTADDDTGATGDAAAAETQPSPEA
jgi:polyisoprenoid-binding protein YceI